MEIYGELVEIGALKGSLSENQDPTGRYALHQPGKTTVASIDLRADAPVEVARWRLRSADGLALHPSGERLARRIGPFVTLIDRDGREIAVHRTPTARPTWDGRLLEPGEEAPRWGMASEHLAFSGDGRWVWLAAHDEEGRPRVWLLDGETLEERDRFDALQTYAHFAVGGAGEPAPLEVMSEDWALTDPNRPEVLMLIQNAGDSFVGAHAFTASADGRVEVVRQEALAAMITRVDSYAIRAVRFMAGGERLLVMDRDGQFAIAPWPPEDRLLLKGVAPSRSLRGDHWQLRLPFSAESVGASRRYPDDWLELIQDMTLTSEHVLINIDLCPNAYATVALLALHPETLEPLGLIKRPRSRMGFGCVLHLGEDRFATVGRRQTKIWELRR